MSGGFRYTDAAAVIDRDLQAVVFDFDGVLAESVDVKTEAFAVLYESEGPEIVAEVRRYHLIHGGKSRYEKFRYYEETLLRREAPDSERMAELDRRFSALVEKKIVASPPVPGAPDLLGFLHLKLPLHVVSATPEEELLRIVRARDWDRVFHSVLGSPRAKHDNLRMVLARMSYEPGRVLMIGDSPSDFEAARQCGTRFLGRVPEGAASPFAAGIVCVRDMTPVLAAFRSAHAS